MSDEILDNGGAASGERPTFLTVLCILTFIGSGLGVLGGLLGLIGASFLAAFAPVGGILIQLIGLAAAGLCLFGAVQMWGLKKQGFMMYVAGAVLSIVGSIVSVMTVSSAVSEMNAELEGLEGFSSAGTSAVESAAAGAMWTGVIIGILINVGFILMYNANKKALVK